MKKHKLIKIDPWDRTNIENLFNLDLNGNTYEKLATLIRRNNRNIRGTIQEPLRRKIGEFKDD